MDYRVSDLKGEKIAGSFCEKELQKPKEKFRIEKYSKEKVTLKSCMLHGKDMIIHLIVGLIKTTLYKKESILS